MFVKYSLSLRVPYVICLTGWALLVPQICSTTNCPPPDFPQDGSYSPKKSEYELGSRIFYSCEEGFTLFGVSRITCLSNGRWTDETPFCDRPAEIKSLVASSREEFTEYALIDGDTDTCFRTQSGTEEFLKVFLNAASNVDVVVMYLEIGRTDFQIMLFEDGSTNGTLCSTDIGNTEEDNWYFIYCESNEITAEFITVQTIPEIPNSISLCEIEVYTKDVEFCTSPPGNLVPNGQLEVSRHKAILVCNEGYKEKNDRRVYATCEGNEWTYLRLQCIEILCDSVPTDIRKSDGEWHFHEKFNKLSAGTLASLKCKDGYHPEGEPLTVECHKNGSWAETSATCGIGKPPKAYNATAIIAGAFTVIIFFVLSGVVLFLKRRKKAREQVAVNQRGENNIQSNPPSSGGRSSIGLSDAACSAVLYESQNSQNVPSAPPLELPNMTSKLDMNHGNLVTDYPFFAHNIHQLPSNPHRWN